MATGTSNPAGSTAVEDLLANTINLDNLSVGTDATYTDRLGVERKSIAGFNAEFQQTIEAASGTTLPALEAVRDETLVARDNAAASVSAAAAAESGAEAARDATISALAYDYTPNDLTALNAITGMVAGETAFIRSDFHVYEYDGESWVDQGISPLDAKADKSALTEFSDTLSKNTDQKIGRSSVITGSAVAANTYIHFTPAALSGTLYQLPIFALATGTVKIRVVSISGTTVNQVSSTSVTISSTGAQTLDKSDFGTITVAAGQYLALYGGSTILASTENASDGDGWKQLSGDTGSGTYTNGNNAARLEWGYVVRNKQQVVTSDRFVAAESNAAEAKNATDLLKKIVNDRMGRSTTPTDGGGNVGANTFVQYQPIPRTTNLNSVTVFAAATGTLKVAQYSLSGDTLTRVSSQSVAVTGTGVQTLAFDLDVIGGNYIAFEGNGIVSRTLSVGADDGGWTQLAANATTGTRVLSSSTTRLEIQYNFSAEVQTVTADALRASMRQYYNYSPSTGIAAAREIEAVDYLIPVIGQSLSLGITDPSEVAITTTTEHSGFGLMFDSGVVPTDPSTISAYADIVESNYSSTGHETICSGMVGKILSEVNAAIGRKPRIIAFVAGKDGSAYAGGGSAAGDDLKRGSVTYARFLSLVEKAVDISKAAGRTVVVPAVCVLHGEQDYNDNLPEHLYQRALDQWREHFDEDISRISGQSNPVRMYVYQSNRGGTSTSDPAANPSKPALAQLASQNRNTLIRCIGPIYAASAGADDNAHLLSRGYRRLGRQFGQFIAQDWFGPYDDCLRVKRAYWSANTKFCLQYTKAIAIESDDSRVTISTLGNGKGIDFSDGSVSAPNISSIAIKSGTNDTVEITLDSAPTGLDKRAWVACRKTTGGGMGSIFGARSGIRSSVSYDTDPSDGSVLYHWAAQQEIELK